MQFFKSHSLPHCRSWFSGSNQESNQLFSWGAALNSILCWMNIQVSSSLSRFIINTLHSSKALYSRFQNTTKILKTLFKPRSTVSCQPIYHPSPHSIWSCKKLSAFSSYTVQHSAHFRVESLMISCITRVEVWSSRPRHRFREGAKMVLLGNPYQNLCLCWGSNPWVRR